MHLTASESDSSVFCAIFCFSVGLIFFTFIQLIPLLCDFICYYPEYQLQQLCHLL